MTLFRRIGEDKEENTGKGAELWYFPTSPLQLTSWKKSVFNKETTANVKHELLLFLHCKETQESLESPWLSPILLNQEPL